MRIKYARRANKSLLSLEKGDKNAARLIYRKILGLAKTPFPPGALKLKGVSRDVWRIKVGDHYRIFYTTDKDTGTVTITDVRHRENAYG